MHIVAFFLAMCSQVCGGPYFFQCFVWTFQSYVVQWVAGCRMTTFAASCLYRTALVRLHGETGDGQYQPFLRPLPCLLLRHSCFCHLVYQVFSLSLQTSMFSHTCKFIIIALSYYWWHKRNLWLMLLWPHFITVQCDANKPECNLLSSNSHGWNEQQEKSVELSLKQGAPVKMSGRLWSGDAH